MYDTYGIVKVEKYSCNKGEYFVSISYIIFPIKGNPKMSIVNHGALDINVKEQMCRGADVLVGIYRLAVS